MIIAGNTMSTKEEYGQIMRSILNNKRECFVCRTPLNLHKHHIYEGARRSKSEQYGCWVYLCARHHNMSDEGVHFNRDLDLKIKRICQKAWQKHYNKTEDEFRAIFGRSYEN